MERVSDFLGLHSLGRWNISASLTPQSGLFSAFLQEVLEGKGCPGQESLGTRLPMRAGGSQILLLGPGVPGVPVHRFFFFFNI